MHLQITGKASNTNSLKRGVKFTFSNLSGANWAWNHLKLRLSNGYSEVDVLICKH